MGKDFDRLVVGDLTVLQDAEFRSGLKAGGAPAAKLLTEGEVYWVDPVNGASGNNGKKAAEAFATLQAGIDACTADNGDIVVVLPGNHSVTSTVTFDKSGITVMASHLGIVAEEGGEKFTVNAAASLDSAPVAIITAPCRIIGLGFAGRDTTQESLLIDCEEAGGYSGGFISLENCRFSCWYGAMDAGLRMIGGAVNKVIGCSFDGIFGGFGTAAIILENDTGGFTPAYTEVKGCVFQGVGSGKHAISHDASSTPYGFFYGHNRLLPGFLGNYGKFLDNNDVASTGLCADNWLAPLANQAAAFENLTNATIGFADNHYEEA